MKSRIFCLIFILLFLVGCRSNVAIDDIASELEDKDSIIEQTRDEKERTSHKGLDSDIEFAEYKTTVKYETRVLEPKEKNRFHINDLGEAFTLDRIDVKVTGYHIFDDINDIPTVYSDYGPALLEKIRNRVDADKAIDPETGNFYQNKAWSGSDNQVLDIIKRNQVVAIEFTVIPDSQREVTLLFHSPIGKRSGIDGYVCVGTSDPLSIYSQDIEFNYMDPNIYFQKFSESGKEYRFTAFYKVTTAYGLDFYDELYISVINFGIRREASSGEYYVRLR